MMDNFSKKASALCALWFVGSCMLQDLNAKKQSELKHHFSTTAVMPLSSIALTVQSMSYGMPETATAIGVLTQFFCAAASLKKNQVSETFNESLNNELRSTPLIYQKDKLDSLVVLISQAAQFPKVQKNSVLWLFKEGSIRVNQDLLFRQILTDKQGREELMRDFFNVLRDEVSAELDRSVLPDSLAKMRDFFQQIFGVDFWRDAFNAWLNVIIDTAQYLMNSCVDTMQEEVAGAVDQYEQTNGNPLVNVVIDQVEQVLQETVDSAQAQANQMIDQQQENGIDVVAIGQDVVNAIEHSVVG